MSAVADVAGIAFPVTDRRDPGPLASARVRVQNDDFGPDGRRRYWLIRPWSVHSPGRAPVYFRRFSAALAAALAFAADPVVVDASVG